MGEGVPVFAVFLFGALGLALSKGRVRSLFLLGLPVLAFLNLLQVPDGASWQVPFLDQVLVLNQVDRLSRIFGYVFILITFIGSLFALHLRDRTQHAAAYVYAGAALGVTFAGDLFTLYLFWELMALASSVLILAGRTAEARQAAFRYFMWHFFGGVCLLAGIVRYVGFTGTWLFSYIGLGDPGTYLIFAGFCLNAAVFPFHAWLPDAYPRATVTGAVFMSALTTKTAVYILARTFPGTEVLVWAGAFMTCFPIFYAVIANDMRRVLSYSLINQVGFMVCGIGIGTPLAINGVAAHAFCHIIYKALLFMSTGAVLHMTGRIRATDLGGLFRSMPLTGVCCIIGAASISAFPMFSGFVSKSMTVTAVAEAHQTLVWLALLFASAGVFHHAGIKVPYFVFFSHDAGIQTQEPPINMRLAMGLAAVICVGIGLWPAPLYALLPFPVSYVPYTVFHVLGMLELLLFGALAFTVLILSGFYPPELRAVNLDTDWFFRLPGRIFIRFCLGPVPGLAGWLEKAMARLASLARTLPLAALGAEEGLDRIFHRVLPASPNAALQALVTLKTESRVVSWNVFYVLLFFAAILGGLFWIGGGG